MTIPYQECCVVSVGIGKWYPKGIDRLSKALDEVGWKGGRLLYKNEYPPECPPVSTHCYSMKPFALKEASKKYRYLVWVDAAAWPIAPVDPVFEKISEDGYLFFFNGYPVGEWCRDSALPKLGLTRDESFEIHEIAGSFYGLDMAYEPSKIFLDQFVSYGKESDLFADDPRKNDKGQCSSDPRVHGHRHDQTVASVIIHRLGMKPTHCPHLFALYAGRCPTTVFVNRGM